MQQDGSYKCFIDFRAQIGLTCLMCLRMVEQLVPTIRQPQRYIDLLQKADHHPHHSCTGLGEQQTRIQSEVIIQTTAVQLDWQLMKHTNKIQIQSEVIISLLIEIQLFEQI